MNKDLEIIKECIHQIRWSDADGEYDMVIDAAEHMAAEIERLKKHEKELNVKLSLYNTAYWEHPSGDMTGTKQLQEMNAEIARLKTELTASKENELKAIHEMGRLKAENAQLRAEINEVKK
jgi:chromosome segregation ATPase